MHARGAQVRGVRRGPQSTYLDFERPLAAIDTEIVRARSARSRDGARVRSLLRDRRRIEREVYGNLGAWQRVQLARHPERPTALDYIGALLTDFTELHGDRRAGDDRALVGGLARFAGRPLVVVAQQRGRTTRERVERSFGMPRPEGYRKAQRLFRLAERFGLPALTLVDTPGAFPGVDAEERGQAEAIAATIECLAGLAAPVLSVVIGEGGSGGALAIAVADRLLMQEYAWYSVISPEGCASILFRSDTPETVARAAEIMRPAADDLARFGVVDEVVREPLGGAHRYPRRAAAELRRALARHLEDLLRIRVSDLVARRYERYRRFGTLAAPQGGDAR